MAKNEKSELKKLNRAELLTMLISITEKCEDLERQLEEANKKLEERELKIAESGSLAEAVLKINGVMEAADKAAAQYLDSIKAMAGVESKEEKADE